jgi:hypothetical protein
LFSGLVAEGHHSMEMTKAVLEAEKATAMRSARLQPFRPVRRSAGRAMREACKLAGTATTADGQGSSDLAASIFWQIECRAADDFEHLGCGSLLLQRLVPLAVEPRDLCFLAGNG